jgi:hypothetical protein
MCTQSGSQGAIGWGVASVLLPAAILVSTAAGAHPIGDSSVRAPFHQTVRLGISEEGPRVEELDPTDDGFIIIECVGFAGRPVLDGRGSQGGSWMQTVAVPQVPLGPSTCSPQEHKRT